MQYINPLIGHKTLKH